MSSIYKLLSLLVGICFSLSASAGIIKGKVSDSKTHEPLVGAVVEAENGNAKYKTVVNLDGSFIFKNLPEGNYGIKIKSMGYKVSEEFKVTVKDLKDIQTLGNIELKNDVTELVAVNISGGNKQSDSYVRSIEKNADMVQNILSEKTIQLLPDVTVANALQRISGVTIQRDNSGEGRYAIIRGMAQRYNSTLVNGVKIPSPDDKYRFVPMDLFPSDMLERLEVIKALTPNMEGDAIGGTMNLVMKSAPDKFLLNANVAGGYSTLFSDRPFSSFDHAGMKNASPAELKGNNYQATAADFSLNHFHYSDKSAPVNTTVGLTIGDRFLNKKLGVIISASYQNFFRGSNSTMITPSANTDIHPVPTTLMITDVLDRRYSTQTNRIALHNKIDYAFNDRNKISLYNFYVHQNEYQTRYTNDTTFGTNSSAVQKSVDIEYRSRWQIQDIYNATLHGEHQLSNKVTFDWSGVYSIAKSNVPDMSIYNFNGNVLFDGNGKATKTDSSTYGTSVGHTWQHNSDQDLAGYANIMYKPRIFHQEVELQGGGLYRYKTRDNYYNDYTLKPSYGTSQAFHTIDTLSLAFNPTQNGTGNVTALVPNNYTAHEHITAGYVQARFMLLPALQVLGGVRIENTQQDYTTVMGFDFSQKNGTIHYTDVLPSVHFKYLLSSKENLRLSYFKSISRPGFGDLIPAPIRGEQFTEQGNPDLKHVRADNIDVRYELFPGGAGQLLLGGFYKQLQNPIEYFVINQGGPSALVIEAQNTNKATNFGFEAVYTKYIGKFGISANYTYTHSEVTTPKFTKYYDKALAQTQTGSTTQTRPLQGQANHVGNVSLLYKNPKIGLDIQIAFSYTGDRITQVSAWNNLDIWQKPYTQLDFSLEKSLSKHFYFFTKINNLTNSANKLYIKVDPGVLDNFITQGLPNQVAGSNIITMQKEVVYLSFLGGIKYKF
ncbi:TonB-dependent receptor [Chitinophaga niastensis]|uniref:TonB-dependent receptor n=1 Tax=Chitinophaga niastensis TaxID=536980 RepID=A0A2P8HP17_CHINA|nr:TonB-dependent receptor [Chitinophaga niastensis]PSL47961.1 TonB-dependent receptor [Chitinophaga niastensis]